MIARGEMQAADVKADGAVVRLTSPFKDGVYACAVKQVGRTAVFVRGPASPESDRVADHLLDLRPGVLIVVAR